MTHTSKKDYEATARILHESKSKKEAEEKFADYFSEDNPRFDRERFLNAAKTGEMKRSKLKKVM